MGEKEDKTRVEPQLSLNFVHLSLNCANIRAYPVGAKVKLTQAAGSNSPSPKPSKPLLHADLLGAPVDY